MGKMMECKFGTIGTCKTCKFKVGHIVLYCISSIVLGKNVDIHYLRKSGWNNASDGKVASNQRLTSVWGIWPHKKMGQKIR